MLSFEEGDVEWRALDEVTLPTSNIRWREANRSYRYIDLTSVSRESNAIVETIEITAQNAPSRAQKLIEKDDVIFATTRPTQLRLSLIGDEYSGEIASTGYCVLRAKSNVVLPKWIYFHLSSTEFFNYVEENQSGSAYPAISDSKVKEFKLPIPYPNDPEKSIAEQARIVAILDKFDAITNSIREGLPREIELRQKQYEHYRDLLLSFPKPKEVAA
ncbi:restriction endonuclease subunit S [Herbaspirillum sp. RTI4]|uniref:restriction endonuclease subunit S n=1 Tax=Herbaspirillum sp. RTI4 TaxID=3048640 RepID=UPI002B2373F9|nr:restriction endonuclease subunit S [Herbaspirillum sp. RTI4]MEA9980570.1 restriction endonuclease subunit S [Herbaspirillum sp. RTI4]